MFRLVACLLTVFIVIGGITACGSKTVSAGRKPAGFPAGHEKAHLG